MRSSTDRPAPVEPVERTLQLPGDSSFSLSLPKEWVLENDLESVYAQSLGLILDSLSRSADYSGNIAETALQKAAPQP